MKHFLASMLLMCLVLLLSIGNNIHAQQSTRQSKVGVLQSVTPNTMQTPKATKKLSLEEIKALKAKQLEAKNAKRELKSTGKKRLVGSKTSNGKVQMAPLNRSLSMKKVALSEQAKSTNIHNKVAKINQELLDKGDAARASVIEVAGKHYINMRPKSRVIFDRKNK